MPPKFSLEKDTFVIENYNEARPFSSFLPGISGEHGKPMWVFYTNRGQCVSTFGVRDKNGAMLEFYPANKAYISTPLLGFRTFLRVGDAFYEPFRVVPDRGVRQLLRVRPEEFEIEETNPRLGLKINARFFNIPNESIPGCIRQLSLTSTKPGSVPVMVLDGLPQIVPFGLNESLLKQMSRTMEAFAEVQHAQENLPFYKLKTEPSDRPEVKWIEGGFFAFSRAGRGWNRIVIDPENIFGSDTTLQRPLHFERGLSFLSLPERRESFTACAFAHARLTLRRGEPRVIESYYGQAASWESARAFRAKIEKDPDYAGRKRMENTRLIHDLTESFAIHSGVSVLGGYSRQSFLDNTLRGGQPYILPGAENGAHSFHYYSRKHGDMERDYNFFEVSPTYFSQGNGNFRDVNQNRRSEVLFFPDIKACNIETFFNLIQLDGFNPLVIQFEKFYIPPERLPEASAVLGEVSSDALDAFLGEPFNPGELYERLVSHFSQADASEKFNRLLAFSRKIQKAVHGEGYWIDHWTYNLDLLENYISVYPDQLRELFVGRRDFTYYDSDHMVQPRSKKYILRSDGKVRQSKSVLVDREKKELLKHRKQDPNKVRTRNGTGSIYQTSLLAKILGLMGMKAASLDPFGVGLEMEADKPGWCDALNGLPGLFGSSVNEAFELRRWVSFVEAILPEVFEAGATLPIAEEIAEFLTAVREALALSRSDDFFRTWDTLCSLKERFRERTRLGLTGEEKNISHSDIQNFLQTLTGVLDAGLRKAAGPHGLYRTYFINELTEFESLPPGSSAAEAGEGTKIQTVKPLKFRQIPVSPFLEGPVHALRILQDVHEARKLYNAVKASDLFDKKLKMFKLNVPLVKESFEIGRNKIFAPGWLENESIFLHMAYKFMLETLRSGLYEEFFKDLKSGLVCFQNPQRYGRSPLENSSFIASSRFPDARVHGTGFVARLSGATAEWISMVLHMGLGSRPFRRVEGELRFEPRPILPEWFFTKKAVGDFEKGTFGFKVLNRTWMVYRNSSGRDTYSGKGLMPTAYELLYREGHRVSHEGTYLPEPLAKDLRQGRLTRVTMTLA